MEVVMSLKKFAMLILTIIMISSFFETFFKPKKRLLSQTPHFLCNLSKYQ